MNVCRKGDKMENETKNSEVKVTSNQKRKTKLKKRTPEVPAVSDRQIGE